MSAGGDDATRRCAGDSGDVAATGSTTGVVLVTELIRLTIDKLQTALQQNRINDHDLVAMATAVDAGAVTAALRARHGAAATAACLRASPSLPEGRQPSNAEGGARSIVSCGELPGPTGGDRDQPGTVSSCEVAAVAKQVLSDVMRSLADDL